MVVDAHFEFGRHFGFRLPLTPKGGKKKLLPTINARSNAIGLHYAGLQLRREDDDHLISFMIVIGLRKYWTI